MTVERLQRYKSLADIIAQDKEQLARLESAAIHPGGRIGGGGGRSAAGDRSGAQVARMEELSERLRAEIQEFEIERAEIYAWCMEIPEAHVRKIVVWRAVYLYPWRKIARKAGGRNTEASVKAIYYRYVRRAAE